MPPESTTVQWHEAAGSVTLAWRQSRFPVRGDPRPTSLLAAASLARHGVTATWWACLAVGTSDAARCRMLSVPLSQCRGTTSSGLEGMWHLASHPQRELSKANSKLPSWGGSAIKLN